MLGGLYGNVPFLDKGIGEWQWPSRLTVVHTLGISCISLAFPLTRMNPAILCPRYCIKSFIYILSLYMCNNSIITVLLILYFSR